MPETGKSFLNQDVVVSPKGKNRNLQVVLFVLVVVLIAVVGVFVYTTYFTKPQTPQVNTQVTGGDLNAGDATSYINRVMASSQTPRSSYDEVKMVSTVTGFIQEFGNTNKTVGDKTYTYFLGILAKDENPVNFYLTEPEYNTITLIDNRSGEAIYPTLNDLHAGQKITVTVTQDLFNPITAKVNIEFVN